MEKQEQQSSNYSKLLLFVLLLAISMFALACSTAGLDPSEVESIENEQNVEDGQGTQDTGQDVEDTSLKSLDEKDRGNRQEIETGDSNRLETEDSAETKDKNKIQIKPEAEGKLICTYSINCASIFDNLDKIDEAVLGLQPKDGWIFSPKEIEFKEGESVFDILLRLVKEEKIHMEFNSNPALNSKYIEGINNLYEFDVGELSGWTYKINGKGMGYGSSSSYPKDGDVIEWVYTCDQGRDVGVVP